MKLLKRSDDGADIPEFLARAKKPLLVILGPTASGKTAFSIDIATKQMPSEIINGDSRQLYRYLNIGTAKITPEEMRGVHHHLIDVVDPKDEVTAASYQTMAREAIDAIHGRGALPVLVGGSMLYIASITDELSFVPAADSTLRKTLESQYDKDEGKSLYAKLQELDPDTASGFHPRNKPYLIRAMEILETTGQKPSALKEKKACRYDLLMLGMKRSREDLVKRINERTKEMLKAGWIEEVRSLLAKGYGPDDPGLKSHGYREIVQCVQQGIPKEEELADIISAKTRQYAKRQMTWWKSDERIIWIDA